MSYSTAQSPVVTRQPFGARSSATVTRLERFAPSEHPVIKSPGTAHAGFPSVAQDYFDGDFSLDENLVVHPDTTFAVTVAGDSMTGAGIFDGDILLVDRSLSPRSGDVVVAVVDGGLTVKSLREGRTGYFLHSESSGYPDIALDEDSGTSVWGVVIGNYHWQCSRANQRRRA